MLTGLLRPALLRGVAIGAVAAVVVAPRLFPGPVRRGPRSEQPSSDDSHHIASGQAAVAATDAKQQQPGMGAVQATASKLVDEVADVRRKTEAVIAGRERAEAERKAAVEQLAAAQETTNRALEEAARSGTTVASLLCRVERLERLVCALVAAIAGVGALSILGPASANSGNVVALAWMLYAALAAWAIMCL